jgi:hypothetical protein
MSWDRGRGGVLKRFIFRPKSPIECAYCGTTNGLRIHHEPLPGWGERYEADYVCEDCFTGQDDGPCFDDLPEVDV